MSAARERAAAEVFLALGDGTRLSVVKRLGEGTALSATALSEGAAISRQAVVKHLQVLEVAGLVSHSRQGREVLYSLEARRLGIAREFIERVSERWDRAIERLRELVEDGGDD